MKLSILICHLTKRTPKLRRLRAVLDPQIEGREGKVEILVREDDGDETVGCKRNKLLYQAVGRYVVFIDDDDMVPEDYVDTILAAIGGGQNQRLVWDPETDKIAESDVDAPDVVGFFGHMITNGGEPEVFDHSIKFREWSTKGKKFLRCPNHTNPVRRELALETRFPEIDIGEDRDYSLRLMPLLRTEVYVDKCMYIYLK